LKEIRDNTKAAPAARAACAIALLDRAWGKPTQTQEIYVNKRDVREWSNKELDTALVDALEREAQEKARDGKPDQVH
jgi:hypothetical protein